jgi:hypothetical protein
MQRHEDQLLLSNTKPVTYALGYLNSPETAEQHSSLFKQFFAFLELDGKDLDEQGLAFLNQVRRQSKENGSQWVSQSIRLFIESLKKRMHDNTSDDRKKDEIAAGTIKNYLHKIKSFYETCQEEGGEGGGGHLSSINWKKLSRILPKARSASNDRAPTKEEIRKAIHAQDRRAKPIILTMCSSGIRLGAWNYLRWKHVIPLLQQQKNENNGEVIAAKLIVYAGEHDEYYSFITAEAYHALQEYMEFRRYHGENITGESWLVRDIWQTSDVKIKRGGRTGLATHPQKITIDAIKVIIIRALYEQGVREALPEGQRRHEFKGAHGFRKFFKTHAEQFMNHSNVELLLGHSADALQASYYKPTEKDVLSDYLKAVDVLTIDYDKKTLTKQVAELEEKSKEDTCIIKGKLAEKEKEIEALARKAEEADIMKKEMAELQKKLEEFNERYETDQSKTNRFIIQIAQSRIDAARKESLKDRERIAEIEKKLLLKERKGKGKGKQNNKANSNYFVPENSGVVYYRKDRQGRIKKIRN